MCDDLYQSNDSGLQDDSISSADVVLIPACENEDRHQINRPQVEVYVERPLVSAQNRMSFDSETDGHRVTRNEWYLNVVACFNQAGYDFDRLTNIFATMPPILSDALKQGMHSMQVLSSFRATDGLAGQNLINRSTCPSNSIEDSLWGEQTDYAYFRIQYNPDTLQRKDVAWNRAFAHMSGLHPDEMAARIGNREMPFLACNEIAFLGDMVHCLVAPHMSRTERYGRMCGMDGRVYLARVLSLKDFDASGQLYQVQFIVRMI